MRAFLLCGTLLAGIAVAHAQVGPDTRKGIGNVGGRTTTVCVQPTTTNGTYSANNVVGGLLTFSNLLSATGSGILQSVVVNFNTAQTSGFLLFPFAANPSNTTWTDHSTANINSADIFSVRPPISLNNAASNLGTMTNYSATGLGQAWVTGGTTGWAILVPTGTTASLGGTSNTVSICLTVLNDL